VQNTIDVAGLAALREHVTEQEAECLRDELGLSRQRVCLFIGALDDSKRIPFLLEAGASLASRLPDFNLVVAGDGPERQRVEQAAKSCDWLRYVGRVTGSVKARLGAVADVLLMPGRVGLVAVDSFALRTPIVTTRWPFHAPEVDYLEEGVNARFSADSIADYARTVELTLLDRRGLSRLKAACAASAPRYSLDAMVENFTRGVVAALAAPRR
jgi:glycosyltransferase involved in cell wall biosynthesis